MYFNFLQYLEYPIFQTDRDKIFISDIFKRVIVRDDLIPDTSNYYEYTMRDADTLETLADQIYGNPYYYWVIMIVNVLYDGRFDLPLDEDSFQRYIIDKYGSLEDASNRSDEYSATFTYLDGILTVVTPSSHNMTTGRRVFLDFGDYLNGVYIVTNISPTVFSVSISQEEIIADAGTVSVSPPYLRYYMKNFEEDNEFYETDKMTYDSIVVDNLKDKKSAYEVEEIQNSNKRVIKILKPEFLFNFVNAFKRKLGI